MSEKKTKNAGLAALMQQTALVQAEADAPMAQSSEWAMVTFRLPADMARGLKTRSAQLDITQSRVVQALVEGWLDGTVNVDYHSIHRPKRGPKPTRSARSN